MNQKTAKKSNHKFSAKKSPYKGNKFGAGTRNRNNSEMLYIGNLHYKINERDLVGIFGRYGKVGHVKLVIDLKTKRSKGIAFVEMFDRDDAANAIAGLDGKSIDGRMAKVSMAIPQKN